MAHHRLAATWRESGDDVRAVGSNARDFAREDRGPVETAVRAEGDIVRAVHTVADSAFDFTRLMRRAWGAMRAIDYLETLPQVDRERIGIAGHSRNGKLSVIASAFDERFAAMISSSSGAGGSQRLCIMSEFTRPLRSLLTITTRQGVMISPSSCHDSSS